MNDYGFKLNISGVLSKDSNLSLGLHFTDSDGSDINVESDGNDYPKVTEEIFLNLVKEYAYQKKKREIAAKTEAVKDDETESLRTDLKLANQRIEYLQKRLDAMQGKKSAEKTDSNKYYHHDEKVDRANSWKSWNYFNPFNYL